MSNDTQNALENLNRDYRRFPWWFQTIVVLAVVGSVAVAYFVLLMVALFAPDKFTWAGFGLAVLVIALTMVAKARQRNNVVKANPNLAPDDVRIVWTWNDIVAILLSLLSLVISLIEVQVQVQVD